MFLVSDELIFEAGDVIGVYTATREQDGYKKGVNVRTRQIARFPLHKTEMRFNIVKYPVYDEVPWTDDGKST